MIEVGSLVQSLSNDLGIGKVIEISNFDATIEYFCSVGQRIKKTLPLSSLCQIKLQRQTRCYIWSNGEIWTIGRIEEWDNYVCKYQIALPNSQTILADVQDVYVRCNIPIKDPIEVLAMKGHETPYFHDRRLAFVKSLIEQRAISCGLAGLLSAKIHLYPHQVEVVRRVLEDPIQRYLLADEVGLGKTIEAGAILRQYLLDEPQGLAVVLVPQYLLAQWRKELEDKFYLAHFSHRVQVLAVEDVNQVSDANIGCLIIDEAHHIAAMAKSLEPLQQSRFETCKHLAHKSDRLLLLSATPVLNHEQDFLAMLHLLDPTTYQLHDLEGFRARVKNRQQIGRVLLCLKPDANPFVLKTNLGQLRNLFAQDKYLLNLADKLQNCLQTETLPKDRERIVRAIRTHISDTYRLHRRMLRNRRTSVEDAIFDRNLTPKVEYDLDERSLSIHEQLDEWRTVAPNTGEYSQIFLLLFLAAGSWLNILEQLIQVRLSGVAHAGIIREFGIARIRILTTTPKFSGEEEILQSLLNIIRQPSEDGDRIELLKTLLIYHLSERFGLQSWRGKPDQLLERVQQRILRPIPGDVFPKIIVFTSFVQSCCEIVRCLAATFGAQSVASHNSEQSRTQADNSLNQFKHNPNCFILICDSSGEEGCNFQFADWMIHFDLPMSPNRIEQRIGRMDRIGRPQTFQLTIFAGADLEDSPHHAWYQLLKDGFGIFRQSIASLQFYIDEKLPQLEATLFQSGASGLLEKIQPVQQEIATEQVKISEQNALDEIDALAQSATQYFQALDDYDARHQEIQQAIEGWICQALQFKPIDHPNLSRVRRYQPTTYTLIPINDLKTRFAPNAPQFGAYNRKLAIQNSDVDLYRIGQGLIEALAAYIDWDDRGQAFAMWRCDRSFDSREGMEWFGFRFNYIVEANLVAAKQVLKDYKLDRTKEKILQRRADALFPPIVETIFIDAQYEQMVTVEDLALLNILKRSYNGKSSNLYRDYNLAKSRLPILDRFVDASHWQYFCQKARRTSEELLRDRPSFIDLCKQRAKIAEQKLRNRVDQLRLRLHRLTESEQTFDFVLERELSYESALSQAILDGIYHPHIRLDSVGFIVISAQPPVLCEEDKDNWDYR